MTWPAIMNPPRLTRDGEAWLRRSLDLMRKRPAVAGERIGWRNVEPIDGASWHIRGFAESDAGLTNFEEQFFARPNQVIAPCAGNAMLLAPRPTGCFKDPEPVPAKPSAEAVPVTAPELTPEQRQNLIAKAQAAISRGMGRDAALRRLRSVGIIITNEI